MTDRFRYADARAKMEARLKEVAQRHIPTMNAESAARRLSNYDSTNPFSRTYLRRLDEAIPAAAADHAPGISPSESAGGLYALGPGDQNVYAALRDSNVLNAAVGRKPVESAQRLAGGLNHAVDSEGEPAWKNFSTDGLTGTPLEPELADQYRLAHMGGALEDDAAAAARPAQYATFFGSPYPQHQILPSGGGIQLDAIGRSGDSAVANLMSHLAAWSDASRDAGRRQETSPLGKLLDDVAHTPDLQYDPEEGIPAVIPAAAQAVKWAKNFPSALYNQYARQAAHLNATSPSPYVSEGSPADRAAEIAGFKDMVDASAPPSIDSYGQSIGMPYSPSGGALADLTNEVVDPFTAAGLVRAAATGIKSARPLAGLGQMVAGEAMDEGSSPLNYLMALTAPLTQWEVPAQEQGAESKYLAEQAQRDATLERIRQALGR